MFCATVDYEVVEKQSYGKNEEQSDPLYELCVCKHASVKGINHLKLWWLQAIIKYSVKVNKIIAIKQHGSHKCFLSDKTSPLDEIRKVYSWRDGQAVRLSIKETGIESERNRRAGQFVEGVLIIVRRDHSDPWMNTIQAKHQSDVKTQMHSHLLNNKCLEVMVVSAEAERVKELLRAINAEAKADYVKFVRS